MGTPEPREPTAMCAPLLSRSQGDPATFVWFCVELCCAVLCCVVQVTDGHDASNFVHCRFSCAGNVNSRADVRLLHMHRQGKVVSWRHD